MITPKNKRILRQYLEGTISVEEKRKLEKDLDVNSELKAYVEEMAQIDKLLLDTAKDSPKIDLKEPIMHSIRQKAAEAGRVTPTMKQQSSVNPWKQMLIRLFPNPRLNVAYAFFAGLILGLAIFGLFIRSGSSDYRSGMEMTGTLSNKDADEIFTLPVDLPSVKLNFNASRLPQNFTRLMVDVVSDKSTNVNISFNHSSFQIWSLRAVENKQECQILAGYDFVEIGNQGQNTYLVLLKKLTSVDEDLNLSIYVDGNLEYNTKVPI